MRIGIDLDDVLADFISEFASVAYDLYGRPERGTKPVDWEWSNFGLSKEEQKVVWSRIIDTFNFWEKLKADPGASYSSLLRLTQDGHELFFITARATTEGNTVQEQSARWLYKRFDLKFPTVIVDTNKGPIAAALRLNYFVDDRPKNCIEIKEAVPGCQVFLKNSSHNAAFVTPWWLERVQDFDEFTDRVLSVKG